MFFKMTTTSTTIKNPPTATHSLIEDTMKNINSNKNALTSNKIINACDTIKHSLEKLPAFWEPSLAQLEDQQAIHNKLSNRLDHFINQELPRLPNCKLQLIQAIDLAKIALCKSQQEVENLSIRLKKSEYLYAKYFGENSFLSSASKNHQLSTSLYGCYQSIYSSSADSPHSYWSLTQLKKHFITDYMTDPLEIEEKIKIAKKAYQTSPAILEVLEEMYAEVINPQLPVDDPAAAIASLTS
jgi:hypothetical protein